MSSRSEPPHPGWGSCPSSPPRDDGEDELGDASPREAQRTATAPAPAGGRDSREGLAALEDESNVRPAEITALLGRGTHFEGKLHFDGPGSPRRQLPRPTSAGTDVLVAGGRRAGRRRHRGWRPASSPAARFQANIRPSDAIELYAPAKVAGALRASGDLHQSIRGVLFEGSLQDGAARGPRACGHRTLGHAGRCTPGHRRTRRRAHDGGGVRQGSAVGGQRRRLTQAGSSATRVNGTRRRGGPQMPHPGATRWPPRQPGQVWFGAHLWAGPPDSRSFPGSFESPRYLGGLPRSRHEGCSSPLASPEAALHPKEP